MTLRPTSMLMGLLYALVAAVILTAACLLMLASTMNHDRKHADDSRLYAAVEPLLPAVIGTENGSPTLLAAYAAPAGGGARAPASPGKMPSFRPCYGLIQQQQRATPGSSCYTGVWCMHLSFWVSGTY